MCLHVGFSQDYAKPLLEMKKPNFEVNRIILLASVHLKEINGEKKYPFKLTRKVLLRDLNDPLQTILFQKDKQVVN